MGFSNLRPSPSRLKAVYKARLCPAFWGSALPAWRPEAEPCTSLVTGGKNCAHAGFDASQCGKGVEIRRLWLLFLAGPASQAARFLENFGIRGQYSVVGILCREEYNVSTGESSQTANIHHFQTTPPSSSDLIRQFVSLSGSIWLRCSRPGPYPAYSLQTVSKRAAKATDSNSATPMPATNLTIIYKSHMDL